MLAAYFEVLLGLVHRQVLSTLSIAVAALVNLVLNIVLIPPYGITGAAVATATAFMCQLFVSFVFSRRYLRFKLDGGVPLRVLAASAGMGACVWMLKDVLAPTSFPILVLEIAFGAAIYAALAAAFGVIPRSAWNQFTALILQARGKRA